MQAMRDRSLVAVSSLREFFRDAFHEATEHQHLAIDEQSEQYVVNLLTMFSRADALYETTPEGLRLRPLAPAPLCCAGPALRGPPRPASAGCSGSATCRCSSPASSRGVSRAS